MTVASRRCIVTLKLPKKVPQLVLFARAILKAVTGNATLPNPVPKLAVLSAAIDDLDAAEVATQSRAPGAVPMRNEKRVVLESLLDQLKAYVQSVSDADIEGAATVVVNAGMSIKRTPGGQKRTFVAKHGSVSGSVKLMAPAAARRASYDWESSSDGGKTWLRAPGTLRATTVVSGFQPGSTVLFRYRPTTKTGEADWSQPVSIIVL